MSNMPDGAALLRGLTSALGALPGVDVRAAAPRSDRAGSGIDTVLDAEVKGRPVRVFVQGKSAAYPRDVREVVHRLEALRARTGNQRGVLFFVAPSIPESSRALLRQRGIGYWDVSGSLYLDLPWAHYWIDRRPPGPGPRRLRSPYRGRSAQVLHALLLEPARAWHVHELAEHAAVAPSTVHEVFTFLEDQLWVEKQGAGPRAVRVVREPGALLDAWAETHSLATYAPHRFHRWTQRPDDLLRAVGRALDDAGVDYALTLASGARLVVPCATDAGTLHLLVPADADLERAARAAALRPADEGATVTFLATRDRWPLLFRRRVEGVCVASDVQLYLDLSASPARGQEPARHLRAERLGY
jgi:hypothetical protein